MPYSRDIGVVFMGYLDELSQLGFLEERERAPGKLDTVNLMRHAGFGLATNCCSIAVEYLCAPTCQIRLGDISCP